MIQKTNDSGVSPVIGVILMVAITVIIAAVVANFVLDLGGSLEEDADATITFNQDANYNDESYDITITTTALDNADYTYVQIAGGLDETQGASFIQESSHNDPDSLVSPDHEEISMVNSGDRVTVADVGEENGEIDVQVFGVLEGSSNQIASYGLSDDQRFFE